jgi:hypothetical protein
MSALACSANPPAPRSIGHVDRAGVRTPPAVPEPPVVLAENGRARIALHVPPEILEDPEKPPLDSRGRRQALARALARASVADLLRVFRALSGADLSVVLQPPSENSALLPVLIGRYGEARFGPPPVRGFGGQGYRAIVERGAIGLYGETDIATLLMRSTSCSTGWAAAG